MQTSTKYSFVTILFLLVFFLFSAASNGQTKKFNGTEVLKNGDKTALQTTPLLNPSDAESLDEHLTPIKNTEVEKYVRGGTVLWLTQHSESIGSPVELSSDGKVPVVAWTLNQQRISLYPELNATPVWEYFTPGVDGSAALSASGDIIAVTAFDRFLLLNKTNGSIVYELTLPDSFYASLAAVTRDGQRLVFLAGALGASNTARAYGINLSPAPAVAWTYDVPYDVITNWSGVSISASGEKVVLTGRHHLYVLNCATGALIWDHFVDNTEANTAISGDGNVIVTADNSGFVQTRLFNSTSNSYELLWQYRVPAGIYTNWATSAAISADGNTILAGSMIFLSAGYDGSVMCFDTYGNGIPKWIYGGAGDMVEDISISDDGRVAAASTWGDLEHTKPDLLVFDVATGTVTFNVITSGSFFSGDISSDGKRVLAGGKGTHARQFGMGGWVYYSEIDLGGGAVSGTVDLAGTTNESGVIVKAEGTQRFAVTDATGSYIIENIPAGTYTIKAEKPGYSFGSAAGIVVTEGNTTANVNFSLSTVPQTAPSLTASTGLTNHILLNWMDTFSAERKKQIARITGDEFEPQAFDVVSRTVNQKESNSAPDNYAADSIAVYRSLVVGGPYTKIAVVSALLTSYADSAVFPLRNYYYVINQFNETGQTTYSNEAIGKVSDSLLTFSVVVPQSANLPNIDGTLSPGEWSDAFKVDISDVFGYSGSSPTAQGTVFMYLKFNQENKTLYVAGEDFKNLTLDNNEGFGFYLDDNNNDKFESPDVLQVYTEGNFWAYWHPSGAMVRFRPVYTNGGVGTVDTLFSAPVAFSVGSGHLQGEFAIPMGFNDGKELQVYAPDKKVGLGAFLIARDGGQTLFNGWWPQTMNSVFSPQYFGDAQINVNLTAPPQAPSNLAVTQQGSDLLVTWSDPTLGLNNDPLPSPPFINVYKNNTLLVTLNAGVESLLDEDVSCERWYEYKFEAFIIVGQDTMMSPRSNSIGEFACTTPTLTEIKYDDGGWEAFYVVDFTYYDNKFALRFTPDFYPARVLRMQTLVNSMDAFDYTINADSSGYPGKIVAGPYRSSKTTTQVVGYATTTIPGDEPPIIESGDFWIVINYLPDSPDGPGVGVDGTPPASGRGMYYVNTSGWNAITFGNLMITSYIAGPPPVGVAEKPEIPLTYGLEQNYPNPFNPSTLICYQVPENDFVTLEIYNSIGQKVRTLVNEMKDAGKYTVTWDGKNNAGYTSTSGIYFYKIKAGNYTDVKKMMLLR